LGAGWQDREHKKFGFSLLDVDGRFRRLEEGLEVVTHLLRKDSPLSFSGEFYELQEAVMLPRPARPGGPPILIGGNGEKRTLPLVARYADEWNAVFATADEVRRLNSVLDKLLEAVGRHPGEIRRSLMTGCVFGEGVDGVEKASQVYGEVTLDELLAAGFIIGMGPQVGEQLAQLAETNIDRVMLQWLDLDDLDGLEALAKAVL
jgi:alkanesulfonate monooxygenase SsuD/methylene tetrahydromethanopterin reductase-like flavin-dependent oxidoreductase (luciferase family)